MTPRTVSSLLVSLALPQGIRKLVQGTPDQLGLLPEVGGQETVSVGDSHEGSLEGVLEGLGGTGGRGVGVLDTSELEESLDGGGGNEASTARSGDKLSRAHVSLCPAIHFSFFGHRYLLRWTGIRTRTVTEPHLPDSLQGRE